MLKLERSKRALAVALAVVTVVAALIAGAGLFSTDKSKTDAFEMTITESIKPALASVSATDEVITGVVVEHIDVNKVSVTGTVASDYDGAVAIRIGTDVLRSQIFGLTPDEDGEFSDIFELNATFCAEFANVVPVTVCYDGDKELYLGNIGVVTYDYDTGVIRYPADVMYLTETGYVALTTSYVPANAKLVNGKVSVMYGDKVFTFAPNPAPVADAPEKGNDGVYDQVGVDGTPYTITACLNTTAGREYAMVIVNGSIGASYGIADDDWMSAEEASEVEGLVPGAKYSVWVRATGGNGVLPSAPVYLGYIIAMDKEDAVAKNAFIKAYDEKTDGGNKLYPNKVTVTSAEIRELINLYNVLPQYICDLEQISDKGEYLVLSEYLAKHYDLMVAADGAVKFDDLFGADKFTKADAEAALRDFKNIDEYLRLNNMDNVADADFIIDLGTAYAKLCILKGVDADDVAKDSRFEAVDYIYNNRVASFKEAVKEGYITAPEAFELAVIDFPYELDFYCVEYELALFEKEYSADIEECTTAGFEEMLEVLAGVNTYTQDGAAEKQNFGQYIYSMIAEAYAEMMYEIDTKNDAVAEEIVENAFDEFKEDVMDILTNGGDIFDLPSLKGYYEAAVRGVNTRLKYLAELEGIAALKTGDAEVDAVADYYYAFLETAEDAEIWYMAYESADAYETLFEQIDEIVDYAKKHVAFEIAVDKAYADIDATKNGAANVDPVADKYAAMIELISFDYDTIDTINANIAKIVEDAKAETDFEKKRNSAKDDLAAQLAALKSKNEYTEDALTDLDGMLAAANTKLAALKYADGKRVTDIDAQILATLTEFKSVKLNALYFGTKGEELSGKVTAENGVVSSLTVTLSKSNEKTELSGSKSSVVTGKFSSKKISDMTNGKKVLFSITLNPAGVDAATLKADGNYIVKILIPKEYRDEVGLQVVSEKGDTTYIYDTVRAGAYLVFTVDDLNTEFHIVSDDMTNYLWVVILLSALFVVEVIAIIHFVTKKKKRR